MVPEPGVRRRGRGREPVPVWQHPFLGPGSEVGLPGSEVRLPGALPHPQALSGSARSETADMRSVRWAVWSPVPGTGDTDVILPLCGGARRGPCQALVYQTPPSSRQVRVCWPLAALLGFRARELLSEARGRLRVIQCLKAFLLPTSGEARGVWDCPIPCFH